MDTSTGIVCPMTKLEWEDAASASNCSTQGEYHCLKNEKGKHSKKCIRKVWVQKEMCPEYNTKADKIDVDKCLAEREDCPSETYWSDEVYKYPKCLELSVTKTTFPTTSHAMIQHPTSKQPDTGSSIPQPIIIAAVSCTCVVVFIIIALLMYFCIFKRRKHDQMDHVRGERPTDTHAAIKLLPTDQMDHVSATSDGERPADTHAALKLTPTDQMDHVRATSDGERPTDTHAAMKLTQNKGIEIQQPRNDRDVIIEENIPTGGQQRRIDSDKNVKALKSGAKSGNSYLDKYKNDLDSSRQVLNQNTGGAVHGNRVVKPGREKLLNSAKPKTKNSYSTSIRN